MQVSGLQDTQLSNRLEGAWENDGGVRFVTILIALTGGTINDDDEGISVELINGGTELMV